MKNRDFPFTDLELQAAAKLVRQKKLAEINENAIDHSFSAEFEKKMGSVTKRISIRSAFKTIRRGVAAVLIFALLFCCAWLTFDAEARAAVTRFVRTFYGNTIRYSSSVPRDDTPVNLIYELTWAPAPLTLLDESVDTASSFRVYASEDGNMYALRAIRINEKAMQLYIYNTDNGTEVTVNGCIGIYYAADEDSMTNTLVWPNENETLLFTLDSTADKNTTIQMAENVREE